MSKALPEHVLPLRLAERGASLAGTVTTEPMRRLEEMLHEGRAPVHFELRFGRDDRGRGCVLGRVSARVVVVCQRCLTPMRIAIEREVCLGLVRDDAEAAALETFYDPLLVGEGPMPLAGLLEDELILAMPNFSRHPAGACEMPPGADPVAGLDMEDPGDRQDTGTRDEDNPFSVLESLKSRKSPG